MGDMVSLMPQLDFAVANKEAQINEIAAMLSPAAKFAQNPLTTVGLTWGFIGGRVGASGDVLVPNGTLNLPANSVSYIEVKGAAVSANQAGFSSDAIPLYKVITGASTITDYEDRRDAYTVTATASGGGSSGGGGGGGVPIGALVAMPLSSPNIVSSDGVDYVRTGTVASVATYPLAPKSLHFAAKKIGNYTTQGGCFGNNMHVVATNSAGVLTSSNGGESWTFRSTPVVPGKIAFAFGLFVITGSGSTFYTSPDCVTWTPRAAAAPSNGSWISLIVAAGLLIARSNGPQMVTSPDGLTWTPRTVEIGSGWNMAHGAGMIVGVENQIGTGIAVSSTEGTVWSQRSIASQTQEGMSIGWRSVASNGATLYVAVGTAYSSVHERTELYISISTGGTTWSAPIDMLEEGNSPSIAFVGSCFVLLPKVDSGIYYTSIDGQDWKKHAFGFKNQSGGSVSAGGGKGYFCGSSGTSVGNLAVSDGVEYTATGVPIITDSITQTPFYMRVS